MQESDALGGRGVYIGVQGENFFATNDNKLAATDEKVKNLLAKRLEQGALSDHIKEIISPLKTKEGHLVSSFDQFLGVKGGTVKLIRQRLQGESEVQNEVNGYKPTIEQKKLKEKSKQLRVSVGGIEEELELRTSVGDRVKEIEKKQDGSRTGKLPSEFRQRTRNLGHDFKIPEESPPAPVVPSEDKPVVSSVTSSIIPGKEAAINNILGEITKTEKTFYNTALSDNARLMLSFKAVLSEVMNQKNKNKDDKYHQICFDLYLNKLPGYLQTLEDLKQCSQRLLSGSEKVLSSKISPDAKMEKFVELLSDTSYQNCLKDVCLLFKGVVDFFSQELLDSDKLLLTKLSHEFTRIDKKAYVDKEMYRKTFIPLINEAGKWDRRAWSGMLILFVQRPTRFALLCKELDRCCNKNSEMSKKLSRLTEQYNTILTSADESITQS